MSEKRCATGPAANACQLSQFWTLHDGQSSPAKETPPGIFIPLPHALTRVRKRTGSDTLRRKAWDPLVQPGWEGYGRSSRQFEPQLSSACHLRRRLALDSWMCFMSFPCSEYPRSTFSSSDACHLRCKPQGIPQSPPTRASSTRSAQVRARFSRHVVLLLNMHL